MKDEMKTDFSQSDSGGLTAGSQSAGTQSAGSPLSYLAQECRRWQALFDMQPVMVQRFLEAQARQLGLALQQTAAQARFSLPDQVVVQPGGAPQTLPADQRVQLAGGLLDRLTRTTLNVVLGQRLDELEASDNPAMAAAAGLVRYATALHLVQEVLPTGRSVKYQAVEGDEIPNLPVVDPAQPQSAMTASQDVITETGFEENEHGELVVPYVQAARRFYLPQWVPFDDQGRLLVGALSEAEAQVASMQKFVRILHMAVALAPYMVTEETYQSKRYGMLGQLVNQARTLARYQTNEIIETIQRRAAAQDLNRGLSLSLPYFDDQDLEMKVYPFQIIPAGRIMFVPAFVVRAARQEQVKVAQDTRLSASTRRHLLIELHMLEKAFDTL